MKEQASPSIPLKGEEVPVQGLGASQPALLVMYLGLGRLRNSGKTGGASQGNSSDPFMDKTRKKFKLVDKLALSPNTHKYRFCLDRPEQILGLPVGKHLKLFAPAPAARVQGQWNNAPDPEAEQAEIERKYTPVTGDRVQGYVDLIIKVYRRGEVEQFPDGGKMSQYLDSLRVGDYVDVMGPFGLIEYLGNGEFRVNRRMIKKKKIGMVAGGTGITPMYQLASEILGTGSDPTCLSLLFANRTKEDILLRDELEEMQEAYPDQFRVAFTVDEPGPSWRFFSGFVDEAMLRATMPPPSPDTLILLCGAPPMVRSCMEKLLALGYAKEDILEF
ncbi:putative NADH-cytochrome b5 reductase 1 [Besnoitia besnoiti]|uniref:NADH-cytochrome b5 reductase n=1 Tax=Besnoitia besnoiti TaxID=94643 RepID=A0A2A9MKP0_BESBE|nr:putative NADH-cytochrome b5 reductase 1 [Besnoitia besnoiti]PFH37794.1 putative NADH-cytochrome b5 reductase 1 [Besnoitia besnoiti]